MPDNTSLTRSFYLAPTNILKYFIDHKSSIFIGLLLLSDIPSGVNARREKVKDSSVDNHENMFDFNTLEILDSRSSDSLEKIITQKSKILNTEKLKFVSQKQSVVLFENRYSDKEFIAAERQAYSPGEERRTSVSFIDIFCEAIFYGKLSFIKFLHKKREQYALDLHMEKVQPKPGGLTSIVSLNNDMLGFAAYCNQFEIYSYLHSVFPKQASRDIFFLLLNLNESMLKKIQKLKSSDQFKKALEDAAFSLPLALKIEDIKQKAQLIKAYKIILSFNIVDVVAPLLGNSSLWDIAQTSKDKDFISLINSSMKKLINDPPIKNVNYKKIKDNNLSVNQELALIVKESYGIEASQNKTLLANTTQLFLSAIEDGKLELVVYLHQNAKKYSIDLQVTKRIPIEAKKQKIGNIQHVQGSQVTDIVALAAYANQPEIYAYLFKTMPKRLSTEIFLALWKENKLMLDLMQTLMSADIFKRNLHRTIIGLLEMSSEKNLISIMRLTLSYHVIDLDTLGYNNQTILGLVVEDNNLDILELLLTHKNKPDMYSKSSKGVLPIVSALYSENVRFIDIFCKYGFDPTKILSYSKDKKIIHESFLSLIEKFFNSDLTKKMKFLLTLSQIKHSSEIANKAKQILAKHQKTVEAPQKSEILSSEVKKKTSYPWFGVFASAAALLAGGATVLGKHFWKKQKLVVAPHDEPISPLLVPQDPIADGNIPLQPPLVMEQEPKKAKKKKKKNKVIRAMSPSLPQANIVGDGEEKEAGGQRYWEHQDANEASVSMLQLPEGQSRSLASFFNAARTSISSPGDLHSPYLLASAPPPQVKIEGEENEMSGPEGLVIQEPREASRSIHLQVNHEDEHHTIAPGGPGH